MNLIYLSLFFLNLFFFFFFILFAYFSLLFYYYILFLAFTSKSSSNFFNRFFFSSNFFSSISILFVCLPTIRCFLLVSFSIFWSLFILNVLEYFWTLIGSFFILSHTLSHYFNFSFSITFLELLLWFHLQLI